MAEEQLHSVTRKRFDPEDKRLGRHVLHDSRSRQYQFVARTAPRKLTTVKHKMNVPILDQLDVGSCTGHAIVAALGSEPFWGIGKSVLKANAQADHEYAVGVYSDATKLDPWPGSYLPDDTGSDGLSVAKVLHSRGLISGYQHAMSLEAALNALAVRPVIVGSSWYVGMYDPAADGRLNVSGRSVGGHEYCLDELDVERQRVWMRNSWGEGWGVKGRAWMSYSDLGRLLADYGDCTVLVPKELPPPEPIPEPLPVVADTTTPLRNALTRHLKTKSVPAYVRTPAEAWIKSLK
jgi:hypothetical protein